MLFMNHVICIIINQRRAAQYCAVLRQCECRFTCGECSKRVENKVLFNSLARLLLGHTILASQALIDQSRRMYVLRSLINQRVEIGCLQLRHVHVDHSTDLSLHHFKGTLTLSQHKNKNNLLLLGKCP